MTTKDPNFRVEAYAERARSALYRDPDDAHPMGTVEALSEAAQRRPEAARAWKRRLNDVNDDEVKAAFDALPQERISGASVDFALRMMAHNRKRIAQLEDQP